MHSGGFLFQAFIYLLAAVVSVPIAKRLGLGSVLGYLIAGIIIGPHALDLVGEEGQDVMHFAEFGVVMMLFLVGLELRPSRLWRMRGPILGLGGLQVSITTGVITVLAMLVFGLHWKTSIAVGLVLAMSSTAIVLQTLNEKGLLQTTGGQSAFSVLLFQDIAVIPMLAVLPFLAITGSISPSGHEGAPESPLWMDTLLVLGAVTAIILAGRFLVGPIFRFIADTRLREVLTAAALLLVIAIALAMEMVGLSAALGTFLAGVVLAENEYRHELESNIEPFKGLLLGLFFIAVGAGMDFGLLLLDPGLIAAIVGLLISIKLLILYGLSRLFRMPQQEGWLFSFALAQGGEFAFVLLSFATQNNVMGGELANQLILAVALSMMLTPLLMIINDRFISPRYSLSQDEREPDEIDETENPVIIAGFGRFGQIVSRLLTTCGFKTTLLDHDSAQIELTRRFGTKVFYGDASRIDLLHAAGAERARLLVLAIDDRDKVLETTEEVRKHFPQLKILARAFDRRHAYELMKLGADVITRETLGSAIEMGEQALRALGYRNNQAHRAALKFKRYDEETMQELYSLWGDDKAYGLRIAQRNKDLEQLLSSDQQQPAFAEDHSWERENED